MLNVIITGFDLVPYQAQAWDTIINCICIKLSFVDMKKQYEVCCRACILTSDKCCDEGQWKDTPNETIQVADERIDSTTNRTTALSTTQTDTEKYQE